MHHRASAAILGALALFTTTTSGLCHEWDVHNNARYGFSFAYPKSLFALEKTSEAGDGHIFRGRSQGARLIIGVIVNREGHTPISYYNYVASRSYPTYEITYRRVGPSWFAISGEKDGKIFYEKVQFSCNANLMSSFAVIYPSTSQRVINPVIERMENSFRSARNCGAANVSSRIRSGPAAQ